MRKTILLIFLLFAIGMTANAQKFALIDMEYILENIPAYERANEQLEQASRQWQSEVEKIFPKKPRLCTRTISLRLLPFLKHREVKRKKDCR